MEASAKPAGGVDRPVTGPLRAIDPAQDLGDVTSGPFCAGVRPRQTKEIGDGLEWPNLKAQELRALANENAVVILPIASIEQHGPHLPVMTDTRTGHEIAVQAVRKAWDRRRTLVTPVVWSGQSEPHMPFRGTLPLRYAIFRMVVRDLIEALVRQWFQDILISNSHGGNIVAMHQITDELSPVLDSTLVATTYAMGGGPAFNAVLEDQETIQHAVRPRHR